MLLRSSKGWELREMAATSESVFHDRRRLAKLIAAGPVLAAAAPTVIYNGYGEYVADLYKGMKGRHLFI